MGHVSEDLSEQKAAVLLNLKAALGSAQQRGYTEEQQALHLQKRRQRKHPFHFDPIHVSRAKQQQTDRSHPHASFPLLEKCLFPSRILQLLKPLREGGSQDFLIVAIVVLW